MMLGRYELQDVIGVGSFATVHRALDTHLNDVVVVKVLAENHSLNPEVRERFIGEGRSLRKVHSPHVVTIHDMGESERQQPYLVLSHADLGTLAERVRMLRARGWTPSREDVLVTARSLAAAMQAVHEAGLVHRDLSPGNVLLTSVPPTTETESDACVIGPGERLIVADLGMCKDLALNSGLTVAGGTSGFRPPEQEGPGVVDTRADLWAMSTLMLWLCEHGADLPDALFRVLRRSTADDPGDRHPNVGVWLAEVEAALAPPLTPSPVPGAGAASPQTSIPRRLVLIGVIALLLAGTAGFALSALLDSGTPSRSGEAVIAIDGPARVSVGEASTFTAQATGVSSWVWSLPTGEHVVGEPTVTVTPRSAGSARVTLRARAPDGTDLEYVFRFTVVE